MMPELIFYQSAVEIYGRDRVGGQSGDYRRSVGSRWSLARLLGIGDNSARRSHSEEKAVVRIVGISGSASQGSRTRAIVEATIGRIAQESGVGETHLISIADLVPHLGIAGRDNAPAPVVEALRLIETADLLIVGSPVYKGSYTGLLKHLIDLVEYTALAGVPVGLVATGGSDKHALVVEHHLRPLFGFFSARTLPTGLFITDKAIVDGIITDPLTRARLDQLTREAVEAVTAIGNARLAASAS
jgi:FMN reductase